MENTSVPLSIVQQYNTVTLSVDIMKVAGIPFLVTIRRHIKSGSAGKMDSTNGHILKHFNALVGTYVTRGFKVITLLAGNQFESMCGSLVDLHAQLHITSRDKSVKEIKRYNHTTKDRVHGNCNTILFDCLSPIIVI